MTNLLQQNMCEIFNILEKVPGWGVLAQDGWVALKSPVSHAFFNFVWGTPAPGPIETAKAFYGGQPFTWLLDEEAGDGPLREAGFALTETLPDMVFHMDGYGFPGHAPGVNCIRAYGSHDLRTWAVTAGEAFGLDSALFREFFLPMVREAGCVPILVYPNPLNPAHYVVLNSGITFREGHLKSNAQQTPKLPDWAIVDTSTPPDAVTAGKIMDAGFFDEQGRPR